MNANGNNKIFGSVVALAAAATFATGLTATTNVFAAPPKTKTVKKSTVRVQRAKKPIYVKIVGDRRAAQSRADQLYANEMSKEAAARDTANLQAQQDQANAAANANQNNGSYATNDPNVIFPGGFSAGPGVTFTNENPYSGYNPYTGYTGFGSGTYISTGGGGFLNSGFNGSNTYYGTSNVVVPGSYFGGGPGYVIGGFSPTGVSIYNF